MSDTFCPLPWINVSVRNNGNFRICCHSNHGPTRGIIRTADGTPMRAGTHGIDEARDSEMMRSVRRAMMSGERHPECARCWREEDSGLRSRRQQELENWGLGPDDFQTGPDGSLIGDLQPTYYDLRFGNLCNLKCRMCGPTDSSQWYKDYSELHGTMSFKDTHGTVDLVMDQKGRLREKNDDYGWHSSDFFWDDLESRMGSIKHIYMVGGEPFMIDRHYDFLQRCIDAGVASEITLEYNSNITNIPRRALQLWPKFKLVKIGCSIDGFGSVNEYIRFPSKWKQTEKNLRLLDSMGGNVMVWIACTVSAYNVFHLPDFIMWKLEQGFQRIGVGSHPLLTCHPVHQPDILHVSVLPREVRSDVAEKYRGFRSRLEAWISDHGVKPKRAETLRAKSEALLGGYLKLMESAPFDREKFQRFLDYTTRLDAIRGESLRDSIPELWRSIDRSQ